MRRVFLFVISFIVTAIAGAQTVYTFQGNGNWSDSANWLNRLVPPTILPKLDTVIVNPFDTAECVLDEIFFMNDSASLQVRPGKRFRLLKGLASSKGQLSDRVHIIDSSVIQLVSDSAMLSQGIYEFTSADSIPLIAVDDFITGITGDGYIRRVTSVNYFRPNPSQRPAIFRAIFNTVKAALTELVKAGNFSETIPTHFVMPLPDFTHLAFPFNIRVTNANIMFDADWDMKVQIADHGLKFFEFVSRNATISGSFDVSATCVAPGQWQTETPLASMFKKRIPVWIAGLPGWVTWEGKIMLKASMNSNEDYSRDVHFNISNNFQLGARYKNGSWSYIHDAGEPARVTIDPFDKEDRDANFTLTIGPDFSLRLFGALGPYGFVGVKGEHDENFDIASGNWDMNTSIGGEFETGVNVEVMDVNVIPLIDGKWDFAKVNLFTAPDTVIKVSGDNQEGMFDEYLAQPLKVRVTDNFGNGLIDVPVYFTVTEGNGALEEEVVLTGANGYAEVRWRMGTIYGEKQEVEARVEKVNGEEVSKPARFTAKTPTLVGSWRIRSFANGVLPGTLVNVYDSACPNILRYKYTELVDDFSIDTTNFSNYNEERVVSGGISWDPQNCTVVGSVPVTDSVYQTTTAGTYTVANNTVTYYVEGVEVASYPIHFISFDRIKAGENEYERQ